MAATSQHDSEKLAEGQQVITACALIHRLNGDTHEVFLPKRAATKKFLPDVFEIPGGHIDFGEDLTAGLKREINEEFGMNIRVGSPFAAFTYVNYVKKSHAAEIIYFAQFIDPEKIIKLDPSDHSEYIWVSLDTVTKAYTQQKGEDDIEFIYLRQGLELLNGGALNFGQLVRA